MGQHGHAVRHRPRWEPGLVEVDGELEAVHERDRDGVGVRIDPLSAGLTMILSEHLPRIGRPIDADVLLNHEHDAVTRDRERTHVEGVDDELMLRFVSRRECQRSPCDASIVTDPGHGHCKWIDLIIDEGDDSRTIRDRPRQPSQLW